MKSAGFTDDAGALDKIREEVAKGAIKSKPVDFQPPPKRRPVLEFEVRQKGRR